MKSECCHQHPDNGDLATQTEDQREETDLRAVNERLLSALEKALQWIDAVISEPDKALTSRDLGNRIEHEARTIIEEAKERPR